MARFAVPVVLIHGDTSRSFVSTRDIEEHFDLPVGDLDFASDSFVAMAAAGPVYVDIDPFSQEIQGRRALMYARSAEDLDCDYLDGQSDIVMHRVADMTIASTMKEQSH